MITSVPMTLSQPSLLIERARDLFISERFADAITFFKEVFPEVPEESVMAILQGAKTLCFDAGCDSIGIIDDTDHEYRALCCEIMQNYDFLTNIKDQLWQVASMSAFDLSLMASQNALFQDFKNNEGKPIALSEHPFSDDLLGFFGEMPTVMSSPLVIYDNGMFYGLNQYTSPVYEEICKIYNTPMDAISAYKTAMEE